MHSQKRTKLLSTNSKPRIKYFTRPSIDIITKKLHQFHSNVWNNKIYRSSSTINKYEINELNSNKLHRSMGLTNSKPMSLRSTSMGTSLFQARYPYSSNHRQSSIIDSNQLTLVPFSLPINNNNGQYRRRSVAICCNITASKENLLTTNNFSLSCFLSFSIIYLKTSQIKIQFYSLKSLPHNIHLQQLTIKVKLLPDRKEKTIQRRQFIENEILFDNECFILFSNIRYEKILERNLSMIIYGKDQMKKTIHFGQIGKINFNQINELTHENQIDFIHMIEKIKSSSIELLISLEENDDQHIHIDLQRIKGLKIDQNKLDANCYIQIILLDHYQPLIIKQTKFYRLNVSNFIINEKFNFNIFTCNSNNIDRLIFIFNLYSNLNSTNEYKCVACIKIASPLFCSGSGTIHWQQFKMRKSFSMWHTLNKIQY